MNTQTTNVASVIVDPPTGDIVVTGTDTEGESSTVQFDRGVVDLLANTFHALLIQSQERYGEQRDVQPITLTGFRRIFGADGSLGLALLLQGRLPLHILNPQNGLAPLRAEIAELEKIHSSRRKGDPIH